MLRNVNRLIFGINKNFLHTTQVCSLNIPYPPDLDINYICNPSNLEEISENITNRKGIGDIQLVNNLKIKLNEMSHLDDNYKNTENEFYKELLKIPNKTHPAIKNYNEVPKLVKYVGEKQNYNFKPKEFMEITRILNLVRTDQLGNLSGPRSYYLLSEMAELEQALIKYTLKQLLKNNFKLISVPDILNREIIEGCGMNTRGERNQVYSIDTKLHGNNLCLSGTSEMALASYFINKTLNENDLPIKLCAISRCYRAETSSIAEEKGIYRVHEFTKAEMFAVTKPEQSEDLLEEIRTLEEVSFNKFGLHLRVLDMPPHELGAPAYRKYDIEAWLPGRNMYGEISSCSNCTDYQSRRLGIKYNSKNGLRHVHTLNGTACAIPRMLIALIETFQNEKGSVSIPEVLQKHMNNKTSIKKQKSIPSLKFIKNKR